MPEIGRAHKILSAIHLDTEPPAGGADPADGQVVTWDAGLGAWIAKDPTGGGVTDHGLLSGLLDNDHPQYALADKSSPSPWVAAGDLAARSIGDLGTKDHDLLDGLSDDDHSIYALLAGRSGGQTLKGGSAASEHLTLQSTAHATRGYVRAQDDLQLLSDIIRDSGGNNRIQLATSSPHVRVRDDIRIDNHVGIGDAPSTAYGVVCSPPLSGATSMRVMSLNPTVYLTGGNANIEAIAGQAIASISAGATALQVAGLAFTAAIAGAGDANALYGLWVKNLLATYTGAAVPVYTAYLAGPTMLFSTYPSTAYGLYIGDHGVYAAGSHNAIGLAIADQTATGGNKYLIEAGPATPYLRLRGGGAPGASVSNLDLNLGGSLKQVSEGAADSGGAGYKVLRVPN